MRCRWHHGDRVAQGITRLCLGSGSWTWIGAKHMPDAEAVDTRTSWSLGAGCGCIEHPGQGTNLAGLLACRNGAHSPSQGVRSTGWNTIGRLARAVVQSERPCRAIRLCGRLERFHHSHLYPCGSGAFTALEQQWPCQRWEWRCIDGTDHRTIGPRICTRSGISDRRTPARLRSTGCCTTDGR